MQPIFNLRGLNLKKYIVTLTKDECETLRALTFKGKHKSQKILNALILLGCDEGECQIKHSTNEEMARVLNISMRKIDRVKDRSCERAFCYGRSRCCSQRKKEMPYLR